MTIEQIAKIANTTLNDENSKVFTALKPQIESWLNSDLFLHGGGGARNSQNSIRHC